MARKLTDDDIRAQIEKNKTEHGYLQNAVGQLGDELGLKLDEKGDVIERTQKEHPVAPSVPPTPPVPSVKKEDLKWALEKVLEENPIKFTVNQPRTGTTQPSPPSPDAVNQKVIDAIVKKWDPIVSGYCNNIMETYGAAADSKEEPIFEEKTIRKIKKFHAFIGKCLRWFWHVECSVPLKVAAYELAICCAIFGGYQFYRNQQLLAQHKKDAVVRYVLSGDPGNKAMIEKIDTLLNEKGVDVIFRKLKQ